ncbi:HNH endonuclease [Mycobacterium sp. CBMA271]|uniref:HNH endonuclease signature motif containing protein n=1 Tax=unclassified Mycobacteroides TaxID=2618759 RepID=UPI0012DC352D|nr:MULTISPECIES: HNH endonuclease signature motif containing protein [unclassified Mycobacteroides]MUM19988.1 hypothetical protein [Mycobacteroides sp. CBMA 326]MUM20162.1 HNH endonuclease [Mycobacteroides sp. CBMA 271]
MRSIVEADVERVLDALDSAVNAVFAVDPTMLTQFDRFAVLQRLETVARRLSAATVPLVSEIAATHVSGQFGGANATDVLADGLRITRTEARHRLAEAQDLTPHLAMTGEPLDPVLPVTAAMYRSGSIGRQHVAVIRGFWDRVPSAIDSDTAAHAESHLAQLATDLRPDELRKAADRLLAHLDADGKFKNADRAKCRGFAMARQGTDLMTSGTFKLDPELRSYLDAVFAKYAAPGACNPDDEHPVDGTEPDRDAVNRDQRTAPQRQHDALKALCRIALASGDLGSHRGLPVTTVVSTTLRELETGSGTAVTGGGSLLPMCDVVRMAAHSRHYLTIFDDDGRPLWLGRSKRIATADQRIVLAARDRGCTYPGCDRPMFHAQVHHMHEWADGGHTDIDGLTSVCDPHHALLGTGENDWQTRAGPDGRTQWHPPKHVDPEQIPRTNHFHHPDDHLLE